MADGTNPEITELIGALSGYRLDPRALRKRLLQGLLSIVPANGPCSVLQLTGFFSEQGKKIDEYHVRRPPRYRYLLWVRDIRKGESEIERRLFACRGDLDFGAHLLMDLFTPEEWMECRLYGLAKKCSVRDMAYLWIRCSSSELWVICLRRTIAEQVITSKDRERLREFGRQFLAAKHLWYDEDLRLFTNQELQVVRLTANGFRAKEVAKKLSISKRTVEKHLANARKKVSVDSTPQLLARLFRGRSE